MDLLGEKWVGFLAASGRVLFGKTQHVKSKLPKYKNGAVNGSLWGFRCRFCLFLQGLTKGSEEVFMESTEIPIATNA